MKFQIRFLKSIKRSVWSKATTLLKGKSTEFNHCLLSRKVPDFEKCTTLIDNKSLVLRKKQLINCSPDWKISADKTCSAQAGCKKYVLNLADKNGNSILIEINDIVEIEKKVLVLGDVICTPQTLSIDTAGKKNE